MLEMPIFTIRATIKKFKARQLETLRTYGKRMYVYLTSHTVSRIV